MIEWFMMLKFYFKIRRVRRRVRSRTVSVSERRRYVLNKPQAKLIVLEALTRLNGHYQYKFKSLAIRNQRSRWGSCSKLGGLNFNYKIIFLPPHLSDYVVAHELAHLKEFNHSIRFWRLVGETIPEVRRCRSELRNYQLNKL